jgi:hypothetical protein
MRGNIWVRPGDGGRDTSGVSPSACSCSLVSTRSERPERLPQREDARSSRVLPTTAGTAMVQFRGSAIRGVGGRFTRAVVAFILMGLGALAWVLAIPAPAYAADDQIDSFLINYDMQPSGVLKMKETITWRFGSNSGRHGIQRDLVIREPDPASDQDFVYQISNIKVTSADPGVATQFSS